MIEIIYNESGQGSTVTIKPPKNIRQIGSPRGRHKIYVEDYVYTFLHSTAFEGESPKRAAVLLGRSEVSQDIRYTFISSAVDCGDFVFQEDGILFDESCWEYIYKEVKEYFDNQEIVGWFLLQEGFWPGISPAVEAAHRKYFTGRDKVLFLFDPSEGEEVFFAYEQGILQKKEGYYLYYEKNLPMQEYMVSAKERTRKQEGGIAEWGQEPLPVLEMAGEEGQRTQAAEREIQLEPFDTGRDAKNAKSRATQNRLEEVKGTAGQSPGESMEEAKDKEAFYAQSGAKEQTPLENPKEHKAGTDARKELDAWDGTEGSKDSSEKISAEQAIQNYRNMLLERKNEMQPKKMNLLLYTSATAAMVILCVIGITTMNNYEKMRQVQQTLSVMSGQAETKQDKDEDKPKEETDKLVVESVPGEVTPKTDPGAEQPGNDPAGQDKDAAETSGQPAGNQENGGSKGAGQADSGNEGTGQNGQGSGTEGGAGQDGQGNGTEGGASKDTQAAGQPGSGEGQAADGQEGGASSDSQGEQARETAAQVYLDQGYYIVQEGDKLELICKKIYNTTAMLEQLCAANQITDMDKIYAGQKLVLP